MTPCHSPAALQPRLRSIVVAMAVSMLAFGPFAAISHAGARAHSAGRKGAAAQADRFDDAFRKYSKRYFGPDYDWREFKAQGLTESNLDTTARSHVGARGVMQLMPSTFREVASKNPEIQRRIDDPEWNIAAGISYDRRLWTQWAQDSVADHRREFMFASYNAGRGTLLQAQGVARARQLDWRSWPDIEQIAPEIQRWRYVETLEYLRRIDGHLRRLDAGGRVVANEAGVPASASVPQIHGSGPRLAVPAGPIAPRARRGLAARGAARHRAVADSSRMLTKTSRR